MITDFRFDLVNVLFIDPDGGSRDSIRSILQNNGFRSIRSGSSFADLIKGTEPPGPDLLICETDVDDGDVCRWIYDMRHQRAGADPFLPVIATTWTPTPDLVKRVMDAGADDLLSKPLSSDLLAGRIRTLSRARKPFVVTSDYVGPDRHRSSQRTNTANLLEVPNRLQARATGRAADANQHGAIAMALDAVNQQKIDRHVERIGDMVRRLTPLLEAGVENESVHRELRGLYEITEDISQRMKGTAYDHVSDLCLNLLSVVETIRRKPRQAAGRDLRLLTPLSQAIEASFVGAGRTVEAARQILATLDDKSVFLDAETSRALEDAEKDRPPSDRRHKFLLRLVAGKISHLLSNQVGRRQIIPRAFLQGFDEYLGMLLGEALYDELNPKARELLETIGSDDDAVIWRAIAEDDDYRAFSYSILLHILLKFSNFARGRRNFMGIVNRVIAETLRDNRGYDGRDVFSEGHFNLVFATLFSDIFAALGDEQERERLDQLLGEGTVGRLDAIHGEYQSHTRRSAATKAG